MLSDRKPKPMARSAKVGLLGLVIAIGAILSLLPPTLSKAQAGRFEIRAEQVVTFACETTNNDSGGAGGLKTCVAEANRAANDWLTLNDAVVAIIGRQANISTGTHWRAYAVTIFYRPASLRP